MFAFTYISLGSMCMCDNMSFKAELLGSTVFKVTEVE